MTKNGCSPEDMNLLELARIVFQTELDTMKLNLAGCAEGLDPIHLHDLRVAERRTRAALSEFRDLLPDTAVQYFREQFRWLHQITNPIRDLDVSISHLSLYRRKFPFFYYRDLKPALALLRSRRQDALMQLEGIMQSGQVNDILEAWSVLLEDSLALETAADLPSGGEYGCRRICDRYRTLREKALVLTPQSSASEFHSLRIRVKKLRYQIEFYDLALDKKGISSLLKKLKRFQDILGGYQDTIVQIEHIHQLTEDLSEQGAGRQSKEALERLIPRYHKLVGARKKRSFQQACWLVSGQTALRFQRIFQCHPPLP
ncbi:MAG: CHAD domain-containing protein [Anaerolineales bacterium]